MDRNFKIDWNYLRTTKSWKSWRKKVYSRDCFTCRFCGAVDVRLDPHHIQPKALKPYLVFYVDNGISLCRPCHMTTFNQENKFADLCDYLINIPGLIAADTMPMSWDDEALPKEQNSVRRLNPLFYSLDANYESFINEVVANILMSSAFLFGPEKDFDYRWWNEECHFRDWWLYNPSFVKQRWKRLIKKRDFYESLKLPTNLLYEDTTK